MWAVPDRDYGHRDVIDKLGIKPGHALAFVHAAGPIEEEIVRRSCERAARHVADERERVDVVLAQVDDETDAAALLSRWRERLEPDGGIWLLSPKRGCPGYVDQRLLIVAGQRAGLVDNKVCSVSQRTSAMRFVIRKRDR